MFIIYVDGLPIRVPDTQTTFNPRHAFSCKSNFVFGLRANQSGHLLLPTDMEGNISVSPGERYTLIYLVEKRKGLSAPACDSSSKENNILAEAITKKGKDSDNLPENRSLHHTRGASDMATDKPSAENTKTRKSPQEGLLGSQASKKGIENEEKKIAHLPEVKKTVEEQTNQYDSTDNDSLLALFEKNSSPKKTRSKRPRLTDEASELETEHKQEKVSTLRKHPLDSSDSD